VHLLELGAGLWLALVNVVEVEVGLGFVQHPLGLGTGLHLAPGLPAPPCRDILRLGGMVSRLCLDGGVCFPLLLKLGAGLQLLHLCHDNVLVLADLLIFDVEE
jgi:hypothetical protein